jgi:thiol-disulfide isomerase/thioredoxin
MTKVKAIYVVYANWCPHCVPTAVEPMRKIGKELGVPVKLLDIDTDDESEADELVKKYGDWTPDYIIPQVFLEMDGGKVKHALTGNPQGVAYTRKAVEDLVKSLSSR